jgi:hypothetical protein
MPLLRCTVRSVSSVSSRVRRPTGSRPRLAARARRPCLFSQYREDRPHCTSPRARRRVTGKAGRRPPAIRRGTPRSGSSPRRTVQRTVPHTLAALRTARESPAPASRSRPRRARRGSRHQAPFLGRCPRSPQGGNVRRQRPRNRLGSEAGRWGAVFSGSDSMTCRLPGRYSARYVSVVCRTIHKALRHEQRGAKVPCGSR